MPAPHTPILPLPEFQGKSGTNAYGDFCLQVDDVVGQVMATLDRLGLSENTIIVFTSDNGSSPMAGFEELAKAGHNPSYCFRGHKADMLDIGLPDGAGEDGVSNLPVWDGGILGRPLRGATVHH